MQNLNPSTSPMTLLPAVIKDELFEELTNRFAAIMPDVQLQSTPPARISRNTTWPTDTTYSTPLATPSNTSISPWSQASSRNQNMPYLSSDSEWLTATQDPLSPPCVHSMTEFAFPTPKRGTYPISGSSQLSMFSEDPMYVVKPPDQSTPATGLDIIDINTIFEQPRPREKERSQSLIEYRKEKESLFVNVRGKGGRKKGKEGVIGSGSEKDVGQKRGGRRRAKTSYSQQSEGVVQGKGRGVRAESEVDEKKVTLYKTELCRSFEETGKCKFGTRCLFAHGGDELRNVKRHPRYKTEICRSFWEEGQCKYGKRCCFMHIKNEGLGSSAQQDAMKVSKLEALGLCLEESDGEDTLTIDKEVERPIEDVRRGK